MQGTFQALYQICSLCSFFPHLLDFLPLILSRTLYNEIMPDLLDVWQLLITKQLCLLLAFFIFFLQHRSFFFTVGVITADSVESILSSEAHYYEPPTSLPTEPVMGTRNYFERSHNASHIGCP